MALIGHVVSTSINGNDSPVFERIAGTVAKQVKQSDVVQEQLAAQAKQIDSLTAALTAFLDAQTPATVAEPELTPAEKAAATKAANKAKAEAEATAGE